MKNIQQKNIQRQICTLIPIIELFMPLIKEIDSVEGKLSSLPNILETLKTQINLLDQEASNNIHEAGNSDACKQSITSKVGGSIQESATLPTDLSLNKIQVLPSVEVLESELDFLIVCLDEILHEFAALKYKIDNVVVLKEKIEALQEERLNNITPERIYMLLERQRQQIVKSNKTSSVKNSRWRRIKDKIIGYKKKPELTITIVLVLSTIFGFSIASYTLIMNEQLKQNGQDKSLNQTKP